MGEHLGAYGRREAGGYEGGRQPTGPDGHYLDPLIALGAVSAITSYSRLGTFILLAALRRPAVLAKEVATLDVLSGGRVDLGVGVGWQREEYVAAGLSFEERGRSLDHTLAVCRALWLEDRASFDSAELCFENIHCMPKPLQRGGVPIWVSGRLSQRVISRIVKFGDAWIPWGDRGPYADHLAAQINTVRNALSEAGRDPDGFRVLDNLPMVKNPTGGIDLEQTMDRVPTSVAAGVTDFWGNVEIPSHPAEASDLLSGLVAAFRSAVDRPA
jgi:probable F420-dependent oxidoreductase